MGLRLQMNVGWYRSLCMDSERALPFGQLTGQIVWLQQGFRTRTASSPWFRPRSTRKFGWRLMQRATNGQRDPWWLYWSLTSMTCSSLETLPWWSYWMDGLEKSGRARSSNGPTKMMESAILEQKCSKGSLVPLSLSKQGTLRTS